MFEYEAHRNAFKTYYTTNCNYYLIFSRILNNFYT